MKANRTIIKIDEVLASRKPVIISAGFAESIIEQHSADLGDFLAEYGDAAEYDARDVLHWLGY